MEIGVRLLLLWVAVLVCTTGTHGAGHFSSFRIDGLFTCNVKNRVNPGSKRATVELWWGDAVTYSKASGGGNADQAMFKGPPYALTQELYDDKTMAKLEGYGGYDFGLFKYAYVLLKNAECAGKKYEKKWFKVNTFWCTGHTRSEEPYHEMYVCRLHFEITDGRVNGLPGGMPFLG